MAFALKKSQTEIELTPEQAIGKGLDRVCYLHPFDETKCIKVTFSGDYRQHNDEIKYYSRLQKRNISWEHLAEYRGKCDTNLGEGLVFDLVRDHNGAVSQSLGHYIQNNTLQLESPELIAELDTLKSYLLEQGIIMRDIKDDNILLQWLSEDKFRLIVIDGLGNNEFIPISSAFGFLKKKKLERKWKRFSKQLYLVANSNK